jgi:hypothetical protein
VLSGFDIYQLGKASNCVVGIQMAVTYLLSVLQLMDWNTKVSVIFHLIQFRVVFSILDNSRGAPRQHFGSADFEGPELAHGPRVTR